jgi:hypothetical protein
MYITQIKPRLHERILFDKCQRYFARVDDKFVTNAFEQKLAC